MLYNLYLRIKRATSSLLPLFVAFAVLGAVAMLVLAVFGYRTHRRVQKEFALVDQEFETLEG